ncbi:MAG TPA: Re/Si-specific NAD(P)(+) transhydrogenase subunit alpha [Polyangia bacterium]|jgi:NAD(P) transhydrogenase subunit alpha|nr:Re/Si-specific NAD(P)(+) transhydrogenase subunit alpha [Polyangia bacterium]
MKVGIPKEIYPHECRVAATPDTVEKLVKLGLEVMVESGAGEASTFADAAYIEAGARIVDSNAAFADADIVFKVRAPIARPGGAHEADLLKAGAILISFIWPAQNKPLVDRLAARKVTVFAMDAVPRITRAQKLDALSAMANIAGYRAVVEAAHSFGRFFSGQVTAAGRVKPAQVLILGAGVAGLAAIAAAKGLGAVVKAFDTRPVVREQVESLGAQFIEFKFDEAGEGAGGYAKQMSDAYLAAEQALIAKHAAASDIIISTALIPGKPAPQLITAGAVTAMAQGSVIVDMAAEQGGNCPLTEKDRVVEKSGVTLIGLTDLPSRMARQSSELYATTVLNLLKEMYTTEKGLVIDLKDEIQRGAVILKDGELLWPAPAPAAAATPAAAAKPKAAANNAHGAAAAPAKKSSSANIVAALAAMLLGAAAIFGPPEFIQHLTVFLLACVVGWHVIWNVTPALHTPLMSVTNAISGIIVIGGMLALYSGGSGALVLGGIAVLIAAINVAGGFLVTQRMLKMFRK